MKIKGYLLDTNLLIALLWPAHSQHPAAMRWFEKHRAVGWATCPMTEAGFVRIVSNPAFSRDFVTPMQALAVLQRNIQSKDHRFWTDEIGLPEALKLFESLLRCHQQVTDAYLLALAIRKRGILATFDTGIKALLKEGSPHSQAVEILASTV
jgi:toxin-antitoxin system PIN domain toxin